MNKKLNIALSAFSLFFIICFLSIFIIKDDFSFRTVNDILTIIIAVVAFIFAFLTFRMLGFSSKEGKVWFFFALGVCFSSVGEIIWMYYEIILKTSPYPSFADLGYLSGYLFLMIGFLVEFFIIKESLQKKHVFITILVTIFLGLVMVNFVLMPIATDVSYGVLSEIDSYSYLIGDLILVFFSLLIFFSFKESKISRSWLFIAGALLFWGVTDTLFTYLDYSNLYEGIPLALTSLGYIVSYIFFALGAYYHKIIMKGEA